MKQLNFKAVTPPESVLSRYEVCRTSDLEEARSGAEKILCQNNLYSLETKSSINTSIYYRKLGGIGLGRMSYGGEIIVKPGIFEDFILLQMPIRGEERIELGNERVRCTPQTGIIINAQTKSVINHAANTEKLIIRIDRSLLENTCQQNLGRTLRDNLEFDAALPLNTPAGIRWLGMVSWIYDYLSDDDNLSQLMIPQLENSLVNMLLSTQPHNYSAELLNDAPSLAPFFIKRVERYIEDNAHEPITINDMAEYAGVSSRSLFTSFRRYRNTSPMRYLKEIRLRYVNEALQRSVIGTETVTAVAFKWGFSHLGHFTTDYKRRFGESPSETLAR